MDNQPLSSLIAPSLAEDPRVEEAKKLLASALHDRQKQIKGIKPPNPELVEQYKQLLDQYAEMRGGKLWFPFIGSGIGKGALVELLDGSVKYDFICGVGPHYFGHSHPAIVESGIDAAISDTVMQGHLQQNIDSVELTEILLTASKLDHCFLTTSGAMANENSLKIAFQKKFPARRILAFERCFVGRTLTISHITDKPSFREGLPSHVLVDYIPFFNEEHPEESIKQSTAALKKLLERYPKEYAAMCFELVQGEGGIYTATKEFFKSIMVILKENDVLIFDDEVQCFGRLPELFAFQYYGLEAFVDIVSIGKLSQVCATLYKRDLRPKPGLLSQTFTGSTSAIKAATAMIKRLINDDYYGPEGKIQKIHTYFSAKLDEIAQRHPKLIRGPYGIGCMIGFTPLDGSGAQVAKFVNELFQAGVMSFIAGSNPTRVRFLLPAGAVTFEDIDVVAKIVEETLLKFSE